MARHERGEDRERTGRRSPCRSRRKRRGSRRVAAARRLRRSEAPAGASGSLCRGGHRGSRPPSEFSDAVAIQIPSQVPTGARKPYFIFGDAQSPVDLWFFDLARPEPLQFTGRGSADVAPNDTGDVTGVASYDQGEWSVIFKRPLRAQRGRPVRARRRSCRSPSRSGTGSRASVATGAVSRPWYSIYVEPEVVTSAVGPMVRTALLILVIELAVIGWVRWRHGSRARGELGARAEPPGSHQSVSVGPFGGTYVQEHLRSRR